MESKVSGHWTDDELIAHLYGVAPGDHNHFEKCGACQERLSTLQANRRGLELSHSQEEAGFDFLAAQRRQIYSKIAERSHWWTGAQLRRWASAAATLVVLGGGLMVYEESHRQQAANDKVSDAQLAQDVSSMAQDSEPQSTAPLQALFEE